MADYHTDRELLMMLIDIVSRGGNLLLDIGPTGDGRIPVIMEERLMQIGELAASPTARRSTARKQWRHPRQWSQGTIPKFEEKEFMSEYDINKMVDTPPAGIRARGGVLDGEDRTRCTRSCRGGPLKEVVIDDVEAPGGVKVTLLERRPAAAGADGGQAAADRGSGCARGGAPARQAYTLKIAGAK